MQLLWPASILLVLCQVPAAGLPPDDRSGPGAVARVLDAYLADARDGSLKAGYDEDTCAHCARWIDALETALRTDPDHTRREFALIVLVGYLGVGDDPARYARSVDVYDELASLAATPIRQLEYRTMGLGRAGGLFYLDPREHVLTSALHQADEAIEAFRRTHFASDRARAIAALKLADAFGVMAEGIVAGSTRQPAGLEPRADSVLRELALRTTESASLARNAVSELNAAELVDADPELPQEHSEMPLPYKIGLDRVLMHSAALSSQAGESEAASAALDAIRSLSPELRTLDDDLEVCERVVFAARHRSESLSSLLLKVNQWLPSSLDAARRRASYAQLHRVHAPVACRQLALRAQEIALALESEDPEAALDIRRSAASAMAQISFQEGDQEGGMRWTERAALESTPSAGSRAPNPDVP